MKCIDCGVDTAPRKKRCIPCQEQRDLVLHRERKARERIRKQAIRKANPRKCMDCGDPIEGLNHRCPKCKLKIKAKNQMERMRADRQLDAERIIPVKPPPPKKIMSQKEYDEINSQHLNSVLAGQRDLDRRFIAFPPASQDKIRAMMMRRATV